MSQVVIKLLPDGSGRVRLHWFVRSGQGPVRTALRTQPSAMGLIRLGGAVGYVACQKARKSVSPDVQGGKTVPFCHTDDPRAATCPECCATPEYAAAMKNYEETLDLPLTEAQLRAVAR